MQYDSKTKALKFTFTEQTELGTLFGGPVFVVETDCRTVTLAGVHLVLTDVVMY